MKQIYLALCLSLIMVSASAAEFYRWIDEEGNLQLTQTPPPATAQQVIEEQLPGSGKTPAAPAAKAETPAEETDATTDDNTEATAETTPEDELTPAERLAKHKEENCRGAQENVTNLSSGKAVGIPDPENPDRYKTITAKERQQALEQAQAYLDTYCVETE